MNDSPGTKARRADDAKNEILDIEFVFAIHGFGVDVLRRRRSIARYRVCR